MLHALVAKQREWKEIKLSLFTKKDLSLSKFQFDWTEKELCFYILVSKIGILHFFVCLICFLSLSYLCKKKIMEDLSFVWKFEVNEITIISKTFAKI